MTALIAAQSSTKIVNRQANRWDAKLELALIVPADPLTRLASTKVSQQELKRFQAFVAQARKDAKEYRRKEPMRYGYDATSEIRMRTPRVISVAVSNFTYFGGAHGMNLTRTYNFGMVSGKPKMLSIWDVVRPDPSTQRELQLLLLGKATANPFTDWVQDGSKQSFNKEEIERFWVSEKGLTWEFDQYELGSYASGPFSFTLSWAELGPLLRDGHPLSSVAR
jgi:hypothetical protein